MLTSTVLTCTIAEKNDPSTNATDAICTSNQDKEVRFWISIAFQRYVYHLERI